MNNFGGQQFNPGMPGRQFQQQQQQQQQQQMRQKTRSQKHDQKQEQKQQQASSAMAAGTTEPESAPQRQKRGRGGALFRSCSYSFLLIRPPPNPKQILRPFSYHPPLPPRAQPRPTHALPGPGPTQARAPAETQAQPAGLA